VIDFGQYLRSLTTYLFRVYRVNTALINLVINTKDVGLSVDATIPCGLIINELISNSLKHAFPEGRKGEILIDLRPRDGQLTVIVGDDGIGFPKGLDFRNTESLGLQLVNTLVDQLDGTIELIRDEGTEFRITFAAQV